MRGKTAKRLSIEALKREAVGASPIAATSRFNASTIFISNRQRTRKINARLLKQIISAMFADLKIQHAELGINLVGAKEMARVNWQYLQHEGSTDVITFDHSGAECGPPALRFRLRSTTTRQVGAARVRSAEWAVHGELFVCVDDAVAQAKQFQTTWQSEVIRYIVHGVLHLLGHDDLQAAPRREMKRVENRLVRQLEKKFAFAQLSHAVNIAT